MSTEEIENYFVESAGYGRDKVRNFMDIVNKALKQKGERITELEKENKKLNRQLSDIVECFTSASSGDDFEMAESAREIMEILDMPCYRHEKVKSKLTEATEIIKKLMVFAEIDNREYEEAYREAEQFLKETR